PVKLRRVAAVIKDLLANEGHPEARVETLVEPLSETAVRLIFEIDEGPRFRVAEIQFEGNKAFSNDYLRSRMKVIKQTGALAAFGSKDIYHKDKLREDLERLRALVYAENGYIRAHFGEPRVEETGDIDSSVPIIGRKGRGLRIIIPVDEGRRYSA